MEACELLVVLTRRVYKVAYTGGDGYQTLVGIGYRCYEYSGQVYHVDAQPGVQAVFYNGPYCRGTREISAWGSSNLESPFYFRSVLLRPF
ncbi:hypothetical protein E4U15_001534 [Claviceps sp. LM218 group G6]|nr:hypothetical protein E4U15_001534 [Claviceps sp. LM218 group G6]